MYSIEVAPDGVLLLRLIPEKELPLAEFIFFRTRHKNGLHRHGIQARIIHYRREGHRCGREVLHLLKMKIESFGFERQLSHVLHGASGMRGDEIGYDLLVESRLSIDTMEGLAESFKQTEWRFSHDLEHMRFGMLRCHFESAGHVVKNHLASVFRRHQIVADAASNKGFLDLRQAVHSMVDL